LRIQWWAGIRRGQGFGYFIQLPGSLTNTLMGILLGYLTNPLSKLSPRALTKHITRLFKIQRQNTNSQVLKIEGKTQKKHNNLKVCIDPKIFNIWMATKR
jgi:hypothetical protein